MATILKQDNKPLNPAGMLMVPGKLIPSFRVCIAADKGARNNLIFKMHGGVGDIVCAEPTVRYALNHFKDQKFTLATLYPELFQHLKFEKVYDEHNVGELDITKYLMYENTDTANELASEYVCHTLMHGIDYASLYMWRMILPRAEREIRLVPNGDQIAYAKYVGEPDKDVLVHPGKTWQSRTFPKKWWDSVIAILIKGGARPVILGGVVDKGRASTVEVNTDGCLDLRGKCSMMQSVALMHQTKVILTNDSAPLHMATTGNIWIGFLSTVKHPDHLYTYRKGEWAWRMQDFARNTYFNLIDICPNKDKTVRVDDIDITELLKFLPEPAELAEWALAKLKS